MHHLPILVCPRMPTIDTERIPASRQPERGKMKDHQHDTHAASLKQPPYMVRGLPAAAVQQKTPATPMAHGRRGKEKLQRGDDEQRCAYLQTRRVRPAWTQQRRSLDQENEQLQGVDEGLRVDAHSAAHVVECHGRAVLEIGPATTARGGEKQRRRGCALVMP